MAFSSNVRVLFITAFLLLNLSASYAQPQGKGFPRMTSDVDEVAGKSFDYIVVGGGAAGCSLAATLSEKFSVLVVERGGSPYGNPLMMDKRFSAFPTLQADEFLSPAQSFISKEGVATFRGRVLGGTTPINAGFYSRASSDTIRRAGWDKELVRKSFEWVESKIIFKPKLTRTESTVLSGLLEAGIVPYNGFNLEHIGGSKIGGSFFDESGTRHSAADLLMAGNTKNIIVLLNATVNNIIIDNNRGKGNGRTIANGIRFIKSDGRTDEMYEAYINRPRNSNSWGDVILTAGALGSPQILLLSGVGPQEHLKDHNISAVLNLKGVGQNMVDNPAIGVFQDIKPGSPLSDPPQVAGITKDFKYVAHGGINPLTFNTSRFQVSSKVAFPESKGTLELLNTDPRQNPSVQFNYLTTENDLQGCVATARIVDRIITSRSVSRYLGYRPRGILADNKDLRKYCKENVRTYNHYYGGCTVGSVVDANYRVYGVKGLRVIDGSTLLESPGSNPMATIIMLARYQGVKILQERKNA